MTRSWMHWWRARFDAEYRLGQLRSAAAGYAKAHWPCTAYQLARLAGLPVLPTWHPAQLHNLLNQLVHEGVLACRWDTGPMRRRLYWYVEEGER